MRAPSTSMPSSKLNHPGRWFRRDRGEPLDPGRHHLEGVVRVHADLPAERAQPRQRIGGEGTHHVRLGVEAHGVIGLAVRQRHDLVAAGQLDGAQLLERAARRGLAQKIALDWDQRAACAAKQTRHPVGGADDGPAVVEAERDERQEHFVAVAVEHRLGEQADAGDERFAQAGLRVAVGRGSNRRMCGSAASRRHNPLLKRFFAICRLSRAATAGERP
jgi:hypothetical protein